MTQRNHFKTKKQKKTIKIESKKTIKIESKKTNKNERKKLFKSRAEALPPRHFPPPPSPPPLSLSLSLSLFLVALFLLFLKVFQSSSPSNSVKRDRTLTFGETIPNESSSTSLVCDWGGEREGGGEGEGGGREENERLPGRRHDRTWYW